MADERPILGFKSAKAWETWLTRNYAKSPGIWLRFFKKASGQKTVTYDEALDVALCFGWIDGQLQSHNALSWLRKFTPRRPRSIWSKRNRDHIARLTEAGRMRPEGLAQVAAAQADGRWERAYGSSGTMEMPQDFLKALNKNAKAKKFFATLNRANTYAIAWRLGAAKKPETRERRMREILALLAAGQKLRRGIKPAKNKKPRPKAGASKAAP